MVISFNVPVIKLINIIHFNITIFNVQNSTIPISNNPIISRLTQEMA